MIISPYSRDLRADFVRRSKIEEFQGSRMNRYQHGIDDSFVHVTLIAFENNNATISHSCKDFHVYRSEKNIYIKREKMSVSKLTPEITVRGHSSATPC